MNEKFAVVIVLVTPEMASEMLTHNSMNRKLRKTIINRYAEEMKKGRWRINAGQPIIFATDGTLLDGQHRLQAVIKAGVAVEMAVFRGADKKDFIVIDTGTRRSAADILSLNDVANDVRISSIIRNFWVLKQERALNASIPSTRSIGFTNEDILDEYHSSPELYQDIVNLSNRIYNKGRFLLSTEIGGVCIYLIKDKHHDIEKVKAFFEELSSGGTYPAVSYVRARLIKSRTAKNTREKLEPQGRRVLLAKAWNLFLQGNTEQTLVLYRMGEKAIFD